MRRTGVLMLTALAAVFVARPALADEKKEAADGQANEAVLKANQELTQAIMKGDAKAFERLTTERYLLISSTGKLWDKQKNLEALKEGTLTFDKLEDSDTKVNVYGDAAVVTGLSAIKGKYKEKAFDDEYRWTRVFIHRNGEWLCVSEQLSRVWSPSDEPKDKGKEKDK